jgi:hypothetical protein
MQQIDPKHTRKNIGCMIGFVLFCLFFIGVGLVLNATLPKSAAMNTTNRFAACDMAQDFVRDRLKAPSTAQFASCGGSDTTITHNSDDWAVTSWVDAQNGFGALIRSDYHVYMTYNPNSDTWTLTGIGITGR